MSQVNQVQYIPYGAYELKATYQRNLLIGMAVTCSLVIIVMTGVWLLLNSQDSPGMPGILDEKVLISVVFPPPISIERLEPDFAPIAPSHPFVPPDVVVPAGLNPVDDELFDEGTPVLASNDQRADLVDGLAGADEFEMFQGNGAGSLDGGEITDYLPTRGEFRYFETLPELIYSVAPEYPKLAKAIGDEGTVVVQALISKTGEVLDVAVARSSGFGLLDDAALEVAWRYKYRPAIQNHVSIAVWVTYKVEFKLDR